MRVAPVIDHRREPRPTCAGDLIGLTDPLCASLGLYLTKDYTWRCGDYAYYAARHAFPDERFFWLIEYDVRFRSAAEFFALLAADETDFLAPGLEQADEHWFWNDYLSCADARPWRCLFPVTRLSARAVDLLQSIRCKHARHLSRRLRWPNDEGFVATTVAAAGLSMADLNTRIPNAWTPAAFSFETPIPGETFDPSGKAEHLHHPVLFGDDYTRKLNALDRTWDPGFIDRLERKGLKLMNGRLPWLS